MKKSYRSLSILKFITLGFLAVFFIPYSVYAYTISGYVTRGGVGIVGVTMTGLPGTPTTDVDGFYTGTVDSGWSGTVAPTLPGYTFNPRSRIYTNVSSDQTNQNYTGDYYVDIVNGDDSNDGSQSYPWKTLHHAIEVINSKAPGSSDNIYVLYVKSGTYSETNEGNSNNIVITQSFLYIIGVGVTAPVIQGEGSWGTAFEIAIGTGAVSLSGLEIKGFNSGAIVIEGIGAEIRACDIHDNIGTGIQISGNATGTVIFRNKIWNNTSAGISNNDPTADIDGNRVYGNGFVGIETYDGGTIQNNLIYSNQVKGIYAQGGTINIFHNTIDGGGIGNWGIYFAQCDGCPIITAEVKYNIISGFDVGIEVDSGTVTVDYNDLWENATHDYVGVLAGTNDMSQDPLYNDPANSDFTLQALSPCIDAIPIGNPPGDPITDDYNGNPRPQGSGYDVGAYEAEPDVSVLPSSHDFGNVPVNTTSSPQTFTISNNGTYILDVTSIAITGTDSSMFSVALGGPGACGSLTPTLAPNGGNCNFLVTFSPTSAGSKSTTLRIISNDPDTPTLDIPLYGTGVAPGALLVTAVTAPEDFSSSGPYGGPFAPSSKDYTLQNTGGSSIDWTVSNGAGWLTLSSNSDSLAGGGSTTVTVSINSNANVLSAGSYSDTVFFTNTTNGNGDTNRPVDLTVTKAGTTTTIIGHTPDPSTVGQAVSVSYSVTSSGGTPTGNVAVTVSGGSESCTGTVAAGGCSITLTSAGSRTLSATYGGDSNFNGSTSAGVPHTVNKANTTTAITGHTPDPSALGQAVSLSYSVTSSGGTPTGNVTVTVSGCSESCIGTVAAGGCSIILTSAGSRTLTATYGGDSNFNGSTSAGVPHTVNKVNTTTAILSNINPSTYGQSVTFTATVTASAASGTVQFQIDGSNFGAPVVISGGTASTSTSSLAVGNHTVAAIYSGDSNYNGGTGTLSGGQTVNKAASSTAVSSSANPSTYSQSITFTATVTPNTATGTVTFKDGTTVLGTGNLSGGQVTFSTSSLSVGSHSIVAEYPGDSNFNGSVSTVLTQTVTELVPVEPCDYSIFPTSQNIGKEGGKGSVSITTAILCQWTASSNASWITMTSGGSGIGSSAVSYSVVANTGPARTGTLTIVGETFTVNQESGACTFAINPGSTSPPSSGGSGYTVSVTAGAGCAWTATSNAPWITINSGGIGTGNGTVSYSVAANTGPARTGTMTVAGQTVTIQQESGCTYGIDSTSAEVPSGVNTGSIGVKAGNSCQWTAASNVSWITITSGGSGTGNGTVSYSVVANIGPARDGTMTIAGQTFTVHQAAGCDLAVNPTYTSYASSGGTNTVIVTAPSSTCTWEATSNDSWITIKSVESAGGKSSGRTGKKINVSGASYSGSGKVTYSVEANTGPARDGTMTIAGQTVTIHQESGCTYGIDSTSAEVSSGGSAGSVGVTAGNGCQWTAASNVLWISITSGASGTGSGGVNYSVAANTGPARDGTITIVGQTFTVHQAAAIYNLTVNIKGNGTLRFDPPPPFPAGTKVTVYLEPADGFDVLDIIVDGVSMKAVFPMWPVYTFTFGDFSEDHTLTIIFG